VRSPTAKRQSGEDQEDEGIEDLGDPNTPQIDPLSGLNDMPEGAS
jgi:hypothetical protein